METAVNNRIGFATLWNRTFASIKTCYFKALLLFLISAAINAAANQIPYAAALSNWLLFPLTAGMLLFFMRAARNEATPVSSLFEPFRQYWRMLWGCLRVAIFIFLWALPLIICFIGMGLTIQHNGGELPMEWLWMCALVLLIVPIIIAGYRYGMTYYVMLDEPQLKVRDAMKKSVELMYGNKLRLFGYSLLWGLIVGGTSILTGIVFSWLVPMW